MDNRAVKKRRKRKVSIIKGIDNTDILLALESLAEKLGLEIRYEKGDFKSGFCTVKDQDQIIIKKDEFIEKKVNVIAEKLTEYDFEKHSIQPEILDFINQKKNDREAMMGPEED